jgi:hypothetical protein
MSHYTITPLEKKSIYIVYEMYRENQDGSISWFNVEDHYRWGRGFIDEESEMNLSAGGNQHLYCKPDQGEYDGCEFEDQVACWFEFSDDISLEEQEAIKEAYNDQGASWLYDDPTHAWLEEDCYVVVMPPYKIEFCNEDGSVIRPVELRSQEEKDRLQNEHGQEWYIPNDSGIGPYKF